MVKVTEKEKETVRLMAAKDLERMMGHPHWQVAMNKKRLALGQLQDKNTD